MVRRLLLSLFLFGCAYSSGAAEPVQLLRTGSFHGDEVPNGAAGEWFALVLPEKGGASLEKVRARIAREFDVIVDNEGEQTGKRVETTGKADSVALIRGLASLREGPLSTVSATTTLPPGHDLSLRLGSITSTLNVTCAASVVIEGQHQYGCPLVIRSGERRQTIATYTAFKEQNVLRFASEQEPTIVWAGDLDRDGRLDILLDTSDHYNVAELTLFLSSFAKSGELVRSAATFRTTGC